MTTGSGHAVDPAVTWSRLAQAALTWPLPLLLCEPVLVAGELVDVLVVDANDAARQALGRADRLGGQLCSDRFPHAPGTAWWQMLAEAVRAGRAGARHVPAQVLGGPPDQWWSFLCVRADDSLILSWRDSSREVLDQAELAAAEARLRAALDAESDRHLLVEAVRAPDGQITDLRIVEANQAALEALHRPAAELIGASMREVLSPEEEPPWWESLLRVIETGEPWVSALAPIHSAIAGEERWLRRRAVKLGDGLSLAWRDVTEEFLSSQAQYRADMENYRLVLDNSVDVIYHVAGGLVKWVSPSAEKVLGVPVQDLIGHPTSHFWHPEDREQAIHLRTLATEGRPGKGTYRWCRPDGSIVWLEAVMRPVTEADGSPGITGVLRDVSERMGVQQELARLMRHDSLTGLATRSVMLERIAASWGQQGRGEKSSTVLYIGVDRLAAVNMAYGQEAGNLALTTVAARIVETVGDASLVARGPGAEFIVLLPASSRDPLDVERVAERIRSAARATIKLDRASVYLTVSIGVSVAVGYETPEALIQAAAQAMRDAKNAGRDRVAFAEPALADRARRRAETLEQVRAGLATSQFRAWYMPIADLATGMVEGYEALARWPVPGREAIEPAGFLPAIEGTPLICDLDLAVLRQVLADLRTASDEMFVALNVSAYTLGSASSRDRLAELITTSGVRPGQVHLEVTETALLNITPDVVEFMRCLAGIEVGWYVDDFGTGYSSISHLRDLPLVGLKLDRSFTEGVRAGDQTSLRLAQGLAGLSRGLGLDTVAEGVSSSGVAQVLAEQGWRHGQGWHYGRAAPSCQHGAIHIGR